MLYKNIKTIILLLFFYSVVNANENSFDYDCIGATIRNEAITFSSGSKFVSFKHEGGFNSSIGKYGLYYCSGSIFYNSKNILEDMTYACEFKDQNGDRFFSKGTRAKGSDEDRSTGIMNIIEGEGYWKKFAGAKCLYGLEYVEKIVFVSAKCK